MYLNIAYLSYSRFQMALIEASSFKKKEGNTFHYQQLETGQTLYWNTLVYFFIIEYRACNKMVHNIYYTYKFIQTLQ